MEHTAITYEYDVPALFDFQDRIRHTLEKYPYLVAQKEDHIIGYAYASAYKNLRKTCDLPIPLL